ncbi:MAG: 6-phosphofructokinase [Eubacteriales bacterium]|nr:6-phosphofructokinase [Eubacteriales bacterium]MDD3867014.1 6-phosphofructokinase [Eubacteriales bacterium]MDD4461492.1 6-phosphofructokinase [Eubacteriales bacterium]
MSKLTGNAIFGQSGGPTAVINASAAGVFTEALKQTGHIDKVYGAANGIVGILNENFYDIGQEDPAELELLKTTPSSALGSCRYKLAKAEKDDTDYRRLLEVFRKYNIRYFFYNGGNDSMDTCNKISKFLQKEGYECRVMGVPKTIDNDLYGTDHCPGFASAAKYIATTTMEVYLDARVYDTGMITVIEVMGRHAGWLTASTVLAAHKGHGPDLIYLPEVDFDIQTMLSDVRRIYEKNKKVIIAVSEGVQTKEGLFIPELVGEVSVDAFGHKQLGGTATVLANYLKEQIGCKVRGIELSLMQRCAAHLASKTDVEESFLAGQTAVRCAVDGMTDFMVGFQRPESGPYQCEIKLIPLDEVANTEKKVPRDWINEAGNFVLKPFIDYALPLIQGESLVAIEDGLPRFAELKKVKVVNP